MDRRVACGPDSMKIEQASASDANYHWRHSIRTLRRAECIVDNMPSPGRVLDVGCNNGITSQFLLNSGMATRVTGVELHASTVDESLMSHPNFDLLEGNIVEIDLDDRFDSIIYGAVHHHILNLYGLTVAIETLQKLVSQCDGQLFFETGQIGEGGRWPWQRAMRNYFRTDEEHFFYLLRSVEHLIEGFEIIGKFWIHGVRRLYLRLDIRQPGDARNPQDSSTSVSWPTDLHGPMVRSFGSKRQSMHLLSENGDSNSPAYFWKAEGVAGEGQFFKQHRHHPIAAVREVSIGNQLSADWAIKPIGTTEAPNAIVFPLVEGAVPVMAFSAAPELARRALAGQVLEIFSDAKDTNVIVESGMLLPTKRKVRLVDICDLNPSNLIVTCVEGHDLVYVVDFEQQSCHYSYRNQIHLAHILWALRQYRITAVMSYVVGLATGIWLLMLYQMKSFPVRIAAKQPSVISLLVADIRSASGRLLGLVLQAVSLSEH